MAYDILNPRPRRKHFKTSTKKRVWMKTREEFKKKWIYLETKNFIRHLRPLTRKITKDELNAQEKHLKEFCKLFNIKNKDKITIYSVKDREDMKRVFNYETNGRAEPQNNRVFTVYVYCPHEVVHILSDNYLGEPNNLLGEGIAVCFGWDDGWHGKSLEDWMKKFVKEKTYIPIKELLDDNKFKRKFDDNITYPESGAFVRFLIDRFGIKKFKELYSKIGWKRPVKETIGIFEKVLNIKLKDLEKEFIIKLSKN